MFSSDNRSNQDFSVSHRAEETFNILESMSFDLLLNLTQGPRSDETKRQICFLVHIFHYSDDTTIRVHRLNIQKLLLFPTLVPRIDCCEFITNDSWNRGSE